MDIPPSQANVDEFGTMMWRAGNAALMATGRDREELTEAAQILETTRDLAGLWRSGAAPDPSAWNRWMPGRGD